MLLQFRSIFNQIELKIGNRMGVKEPGGGRETRDKRREGRDSGQDGRRAAEEHVTERSRQPSEL